MKKTKIYNIGKKLGLVTSSIEKILMNVTGLSKGQLFLIEEIEDIFLKKINNYFERLRKGEPLEYIINNAEFYSLDFFVDSRVLIPRDDTEGMVDAAIESALNKKSITLIDVGTGSSCIPVSIISNSNKISNCFAIDISEKALEVSKINIEKHSLTEIITQIHSDLISDFLGETHIETNKNVIITANLPYIKDNDIKNIDSETFMHEPKVALFGGKDTGFELYENLVKQCLELKTLQELTSLTLFIEIGFDQYEYSKKYLDTLGLDITYYKDNSDIYRCIKIIF